MISKMRYCFLLLVLTVFTTICINSQTVITIKVNQPTILKLETKSDTLIDSDTSIELGNLISVVGGTIPYSYMWSPAETLSDEYLENPIASPNEDIKYYLVVTDSKNCTTIDSIQVYVSVTNIKELISPNIKIYPVPITDSFLYVQFEGLSMQMDVSILNLKGIILKKLIIPESTDSQVIKIPLSVKPGIYILKVDYNNTSSVKLFVVTN